MPLISTYAAASKRGLTGLPYIIPELHFSVATTYSSPGAPNLGVRIRFITPADGIINVSWGDGTSQVIPANTDTTVTKTYSNLAVYDIKMTGKGAIKVIDSGRLSYLYSWGSNFLWTDCANAFKGGSNFRNSSISPSLDYPRFANPLCCSNCGCSSCGCSNFRNSVYNPRIDYPIFANPLSCSGMFDGCLNWGGDYSAWDTTNVTDMSYMFRDCYYYFRGVGVNLWNVSNVTNMTYMFKGCGYFGYQTNLNPWVWDTSNVTNMSYMFANMFAGWTASLEWDTSSVTNMSYMFGSGVYSSSETNTGICNWNVSNVTDMSYMFYGNRFMTANITNWNVGNVTNMSYMFAGIDSSKVHNFNQPIGTWNVSKVTNMSGMFSTSYFNQNINTWNTGKVTNMTAMFEGAYIYNQPLNNLNTGNVTNMTGMFRVARQFNQPLQNWDVSSVTNMTGMFQGAENFNQPLGLWNVSSVTNMNSMFAYSPSTNANMSYNQDLSTWCVSLIPTKPFNFDTNYTVNVWTQPQPIWGTCPSLPIIFEFQVPHTDNNPYLGSLTGYGSNWQVDWGDGSPIETYTSSNTRSHAYATTPGTYIVKIYNSTGISCHTAALTKIISWGTTTLSSMNFSYASKLTTIDTSGPPKLGSLSLERCFEGCTSMTGGSGFYNWNLTGVAPTLASYMFLQCSVFNWDLSSWCVSNFSGAPTGFDLAANAWTKPRPVWGTCP